MVGMTLKKAVPKTISKVRKAVGTDTELKQLAEYAPFIPLRLSEHERTFLHVCEGGLNVSEYTDQVDVSNNNYFAREAYDKVGRVVSELHDLCQILLGLAASNDFSKAGRKLIKGRGFADNEFFFQSCLEIGRRYKITNPDKMRDSYGKMIYAIMDSVSPRVLRKIGFNFFRPIRTVGSLLSQFEGAYELLADPHLFAATRDVVVGSKEAIAEAIKAKQLAIEFLVTKFQGLPRAAVGNGRADPRDESECLGEGNGGQTLSEDAVRTVLHSISDHASFLRASRDPVDRMIQYLQRYFSPNLIPQGGFSLELRHGRCGAKLSHDHATQYHFVLQTLTLWREIMENFYRLWCLAEADLLDSKNGYRLCNTGQGMQRCQSAPRVSAAMQGILGSVRKKFPQRWVGISVVHLGDRDVPNALVFIDKYTQIPRILGPVAHTLDSLEGLAEDSDLREYIEETFGSVAELRKKILADFFKHGFDGSGDDGGSCIDGRLTSCWNWCSKIEKKRFYHIFLLAGFVGFDGDFRS